MEGKVSARRTADKVKGFRVGKPLKEEAALRDGAARLLRSLSNGLSGVGGWWLLAKVDRGGVLRLRDGGDRMKQLGLGGTLGLLALATLALSIQARAEVAPEVPGQVESLPEPSPHWVWVADIILERVALLDVDDGRFLGIVNGGYGPIAPLFPKRRKEMYVPATYYARRSHGPRTDVVAIYDISTLSLIDEVEIPAKRALDGVPLAHSALSDDDRFAAMFNWTPMTSLSVVDVEKRVFVGEIAIPGCSLVYAAGTRRFVSLCTDGAVLSTVLDDEGRLAARQRNEPFFDPRTDPVTEKAVRFGDRWLFVSFEGKVHSMDVSGDEIRFDEVWSLLDDRDRADSWRIGGKQHLAVHEASGRLYSLMHQGGPDTHKEPGTEIWVYDLKTRERIDRIELRNPGLTVYGFPVEIGKDWIWPFNRLGDWLLYTFAPPVVGYVQVTQDAEPLLLTASQFSGSIGVYDAWSGDFVRHVQPTGWTTDLLLAPFSGGSKP
jgi:methylamine dehydrogenase heavy chain